MCLWSVALERLGGYKEVWFHSLSVLFLHRMHRFRAKLGVDKCTT